MRAAPVLGTSHHLLYLIKPRLSILPYPPPIINNIKSINYQQSVISHQAHRQYTTREKNLPQPTTHHSIPTSIIKNRHGARLLQTLSPPPPPRPLPQTTPRSSL